MKRFTVVVPTIGTEVYEVEAKDAEDARRRVYEHKGTLVEESSNWADNDDDWETEEEEE